MISWYAVHTKNHREARVCDHLMQKTIPAFLPLIEVTRRYRSRRVVRLEPLFPGYLFVQMECMERNPGQWEAVRWTPGVKSILGNDETAVPVPDRVIEAIKAETRDQGFVRPRLGYEPHARVLIRRGPLAGLEGIFDRPLSRWGRVSVLVHIVGQESRIQLDVIDLECA